MFVGPTGHTPAKPKHGNNNDNGNNGNNGNDDNMDKLHTLHTTIVRLVVEASSPPRGQRLLCFLRDICTHGHLQLSYETVAKLWQPMTKRGSAYASVLFTWMVGQGYTLIDAADMEKVYYELVLPRMEHPGNEADSVSLFSLFSVMFDTINQQADLMKEGNKPMTMELKGMPSLWVFLASNTIERSLQMCIRKLIHLVLHLHPKAYDGDKKIPWHLFMEKCMSMMGTMGGVTGGGESFRFFVTFVGPSYRLID
jgi:hypothetical protein